MPVLTPHTVILDPLDDESQPYLVKYVFPEEACATLVALDSGRVMEKVLISSISKGPISNCIIGYVPHLLHPFVVEIDGPPKKATVVQHLFTEGEAPALGVLTRAGNPTALTTSIAGRLRTGQLRPRGVNRVMYSTVCVL